MDNNNNNNKKQKIFTVRAVLWLIVAILTVSVIIYIINIPSPGTRITYSDAQMLVETGKLIKRDKKTGEPVKDAGGNIEYESVGYVSDIYVVNGTGYIRIVDSKTAIKDFPKHADYYFTYNNTSTDLDFIDEFNKNVDEGATGYENLRRISYTKANPSTSIMETLFPYISIALMIVIAFVIFRMMSGKGAGATTFGKSKARMLQKTNIKFSDVAGADEEKEETAEIVEFLKDPSKFERLGARIPKGVLLVGPPGTGKTLLAKAVAGESNVPFFSISGSDFVELYVGVGASRVRDLFDTAKKNAPCIVFIDEIDAVGRQRGAGLGGGNDEREQTLNQLLVEMDGFESNEGIIVLAATNRADILDPALMRPGRFDRQIYVNPPDVRGREGILRIHAKNKPLDPSINLTDIARLITGFTGADIENCLNEAAILAARKGKNMITMEDVTEGINKVLMGPQKKSRLVTPKDREMTAYHESGHAILSNLLDCGDKVHEVSIIPRGMAGGYTQTRPSDDNSHYSLNNLKNKICMMMGGRLAEEIVYNDITAGASSDIEQATNLARKMVTEWGMSEKLGFLSFGKGNEVFIGRDYQSQVNYSESTASIIDSEIKKIIDECYTKAKKLLIENRDILENMAHLLLEKETIYTEEVGEIMKGVNYKTVAKRLDHRNKEKQKQEKKIMVASQVERLMAQKDAKNMIADALFKDGLISKTELDRIRSDNDNILKEQTEALEKEANPEAKKRGRKKVEKEVVDKKADEKTTEGVEKVDSAETKVDDDNKDK